jgi:acyl-CoA thioesterase YciA
MYNNKIYILGAYLLYSVSYVALGIGINDNDHLLDFTMDTSEKPLAPLGELSLMLPADSQATNMFGDIYSGWVASKAVLAAEIRSGELAKGRVATISVGSMEFMSPVLEGTILSYYTELLEQGNSSMTIKVEVWAKCPDGSDLRKISETNCVQVAIDGHGHIRSLSFGQ